MDDDFSTPEAVAVAFAQMWDPMGMVGWNAVGSGHGWRTGGLVAGEQVAVAVADQQVCRRVAGAVDRIAGEEEVLDRAA